MGLSSLTFGNWVIGSVPFVKERHLLDNKDLSDSTLRLILWKALQEYSTDDLCELLLDSDVVVRTAAAKQLHFRPEPGVLQTAIKLCAAEKAYLREIGAFLLGQLGTPAMPFRTETIPLLSSLVSGDRAPSVRSAAAAVLGDLRASEASEVLLNAARDPSAAVRLSVAIAFGLMAQHSEVTAALRKLARDRDKNVREWAKLGLKR